MKKILFLLLFPFVLFSQISPNPELLKGRWSAQWIANPESNSKDYGVYHFRKTFELTVKPKQFIINITADNRYRLFVNGIPVAYGPARGDLYNWYYETIDISNYLKEGMNSLAAIVWNMSDLAPVAQITNKTGLLVQGNSDVEKLINTNSTWKSIENKAYQPCSIDNGRRLMSYMVIGPGDEVDAKLYPWGWEQTNFDDSNWNKAVYTGNASADGYGSDNLWTLKPRNIPLMFEKEQRMSEIRRVEGMDLKADFLGGKASLVIPANKKVKLLIDQGFNTLAYPELLISKGKGSKIQLSYAEALNEPGNVRAKGNRNEILGKELVGNYDIFYADGGNLRHFRPLWIRTFRYLEIEIETQDSDLEINDFYGTATGYPFEVQANFSSNDTSLEKIWEVGWRTAQLCAGETYYDCPYYEQLQYEGDTRIQALISLYVTGDDRLMRKAILDFYHSRSPNGLTQGRYPSSRFQTIPPFSLYWISMIHDYWMHRKDDSFLRQFKVPIMGVLDWYESKIDEEMDMLGAMDWWNFVDWNDQFPGGTPDGANDGNSAVITAQLVYTLKQASELMNYYGEEAQSKKYTSLAERLGMGTLSHCFNNEKGVMANTPNKDSYSQHASIMSVLAGIIPGDIAKKVMQNVISDTSLSQATFYYRFYLTRALIKVGMADLYYSELKPWREMLEMGLTTFAEKPDPTRSDCHAWSSSPNYDFFATIAGIMPSKPGFSEVNIHPALGELTHIDAKMPHPNGEIQVKLQRVGQGLIGEIRLPEGIKGNYSFNGKNIALSSGLTKID